MKKHNLFVFSILFVAGFFLSSCSKIFDFDETKTTLNGNGRILISLGLADPNSRTVMPYADDNGVGSLSEISFYSKLSSDNDYTLLKTWNSITEMQKSPYSETIAAGTYDFKLTAKNYGATMVQELKSKVVSSNSTTSLAFTSLSPSPDGAQTGGLYVYANYRDSTDISYIAEGLKDFAPSHSSPYTVYSVKLDSGEVLASIEYGNKATASDKSTCEFNGMGTSTYINNAVTAGNHILTYTFTSPDGKVFVYPLAVQVKAGYLSKANIYPLMAATEATVSNQSYTITYNANTESSSSIASQSFAGTATIADAQALGFTATDSSMRFKYWTTDAAGNGTKYYAGASLPLTDNTTLYAQWGTFYKVTYFINVDGKSDSYIQQFENGNSLVTAATAFLNFDSSNYTFCGWDTLADGSGTRYTETARPSVTEDTVLYAQWCGKKSTNPLYSDYYTIKNVNEWNALMGSSFANVTSATISVNVYISEDIVNPALTLTGSKTLSGKIAGSFKTISGLTGILFDTVAQGAEIHSLTVKGPICKKNSGLISGVTVSGMSITGTGAIAQENFGTISDCTVSNCTINASSLYSSIYDYVGAVCNVNDEAGTITDCEVLNCTVNGETNSKTYTGGICGQNSGTISGDLTKITGTIKGSKTALNGYETYTGGYCGYNSGSITGAGEVEISLSGNTDSDGHIGYVTGYNETNVVNENSANNPLSTDIALKDLTGNELEGTEILNVTNQALDNEHTRTYDTFTIEGNTKVYFYLKDSSGGSNTNKETLVLLKMTNETTGIIVKTFTSEGTPNINTYLYLNKGIYKLKRTNYNTFKTSYMTIKITAYQD